MAALLALLFARIPRFEFLLCLLAVLFHPGRQRRCPEKFNSAICPVFGDRVLTLVAQRSAADELSGLIAFVRRGRPTGSAFYMRVGSTPSSFGCRVFAGTYPRFLKAAIHGRHSLSLSALRAPRRSASSIASAI